MMCMSSSPPLLKTLHIECQNYIKYTVLIGVLVCATFLEKKIFFNIPLNELFIRPVVDCEQYIMCFLLLKAFNATVCC